MVGEIDGAPRGVGGAGGTVLKESAAGEVEFGVQMAYVAVSVKSVVRKMLSAESATRSKH